MNRPPWNPEWLFRQVEVIEDKAAAVEAIMAVAAALDNLVVDDLLIIDLHTDVQSRFVAWPVRLHVHDQECSRA